MYDDVKYPREIKDFIKRIQTLKSPRRFVLTGDYLLLKQAAYD